MSPAWLAIALLLVAPSAVAGQEVGPQRLGEWTAEPGAETDVRPSTLVLRHGTVRTPRLYSDFILRFEFRQPHPKAEGRIYVRSRFGYGASERGYRVALTNRVDGAEALGRISGVSAKMQEAEFIPARYSGSVGDWQECEIRAERRTLTVSVNGTTVSSAAGLDEFTGYIALQARGDEGIEFRNLYAERLPSAGVPFGEGARRAAETGITLPRLVSETKPFYPPEARKARIQGTVELQMVVEPTGAVGDVRVVKSLHPDLDEAAIGSARQWQFRPGTSDGKPIPVIVTLEMSFRWTR